MKEDISGQPAADSIVLSDEAQVLEILRQSVFGLWDVVNNLTRLTPTRRPEFRVAIFGSARIPRDHWIHAAVRDLAKQLALMGCAVITGGGPGLMEAANEGAALAWASASNMKYLGASIPPMKQLLLSDSAMTTGFSNHLNKFLEPIRRSGTEFWRSKRQ